MKSSIGKSYKHALEKIQHFGFYGNLVAGWSRKQGVDLVPLVNRAEELGDASWISTLLTSDDKGKTGYDACKIVAAASFLGYGMISALLVDEHEWMKPAMALSWILTTVLSTALTAIFIKKWNVEDAERLKIWIIVNKFVYDCDALADYYKGIGASMELLALADEIIEIEKGADVADWSVRSKLDKLRAHIRSLAAAVEKFGLIESADIRPYFEAAKRAWRTKAASGLVLTDYSI